MILALQGGAVFANALITEPVDSTPSASLTVLRPPSDILLFEVRMNGRVLSDVLSAYPAADGVVLPLGELCCLLELPVKVLPRLGLAEGSLLRPDQGFRLDAARATARVKGKDLPYARTLVEVHEDDIYVDARLLTLWLPLTAKVDVRAAVIELVTMEPFPAQERWEREHRLIRTPENPELRYQGFVRVEDPYQALSIPWVDQTLSIQHAGHSGPDQRSTNLAGQTYLGGDLLWNTATAYANYTDRGGVQNTRLTLGRRDPEGGLLGPLQAREYQLGDTFAPGSGLASIGAVGPGVMVSNFPFEAQNSESRRSFLGELPAGWQVELYQNGSLIGFQAGRADGRYQFLDVPMQFGPNDFRLIFYGPGGERKEEVFRSDLRELQTPAGTFRYRLGAVDPVDAPRRGGFEGEYGLAPRWVLQTSALRMGLRASDALHAKGGEALRNYTQVGLKTYGDRAVGSLVVSEDATFGGSVAQLSLLSGFGRTQTLAFSHAQLNDFNSEVFRPDYGTIQSRTAFTLYGNLPDLQRPLASYRVTWQRDILEAGGHHDEIGNRFSASVGRFTFSNTLAWTKIQGRPQVGDVSQLNGGLLASRSFGLWSMRSQVSYVSDTQGRRLTDTAIYADTLVFRPFQMQAGFSRGVSPGTSRLMLNVAKYTGRFSVGFNTSYARAEGFQATLALHVGLTHNPVRRGWDTHAESVLGFGGLQARAFQDLNGNGRRDPGEPLVPDPGFDISGVSTKPANGEAFFTDRIPADRYAYASLQASSLDDPLAKSTAPGFKLLPRSGRVATVEFPVVNFGQVNGSVYLDDHGSKRPFPGIQVELVDIAGRVEATTSTAYDGFYSLDSVKPGTYLLRISPKDLDRLQLLGPAPRATKLLPSGTVMDGVDLVMHHRDEMGKTTVPPGKTW